MPVPPFPKVNLSAVVIRRGGEMLLVFNPKWGSFTFPMSKKRKWTDEGRVVEEEGIAAALRATAEALGRPLKPTGRPTKVEVSYVGPYQQSSRDGEWKSYYYEVFLLDIEADETPRPIGGLPFAWMTLGEMQQDDPISGSALMIAEELRRLGILAGKG